MPDVLWGGLQVDAAAVTSPNTGAQPGPGGGDGWSIIGRLPKEKLITNRAYVFVVSGTICNIQRVGAAPLNGLCQVALGDPSGVKHPGYCAELSINWPTTATEGQPFQFLVIFDPGYGIADPVWGARWPNTEDLCLYGRCYTNGDAQNYAATFDVAGVSWLWFDIDVIDGADHFVDEDWPAAPHVQLQAAGYQDWHLGASMPGSAGEKWVHFVNLDYTSLDYQTNPSFQFGATTAPSFGTFSPKIGSRRWGCRARGNVGSLTAVRNPRMHIGAMCVQDRSAGSLYWGYRGNGTALVHRFRHFALRVDELPEFSGRSTSAASTAPEHDALQLLHEPPPQTGTVAQPIYLASVVAFSYHDDAFALRLATRSGRTVWNGPAINKLSGEGIQIFGAGQFGLGPGDGVRYENSLERLTVPAGQFYADDVEFLQVWLLSDPTIDPPDPYPTLPPVYVEPSRESSDVGSLTDLPVAPDFGGEMEIEQPVAGIVGVTGVARRWPLFTGPRRTWVIPWSALSVAEFETLDAFLRANLTFRCRPPGESSKVAVIALDPPQFDMLDSASLVRSCRLRVAELIFTGGS
jgi:hypothetical protein